MTVNRYAAGFKVFSTCPRSNTTDWVSYRRKVKDIASWSEKSGCQGILVYSDNSQLDPWLLAQEIIQHTRFLHPLIAVQPIYMHPYTVAKNVVTLGLLYDRKVCLNMVAGGFRNDLIALNDPAPHDDRYLRLVEYTSIIKRLLEGTGPVNYQGKYYQVNGLTLNPSLPEELFPDIFISGSSDAGLAAAREIGATAIQYPKPVEEYQSGNGNGGEDLEFGVRIGVLCREDSAKAWHVAHERFPEDRKGQMTRKMAMKMSDSVWHQQLSETDDQPGDGGSPYWLVPFRNYKTMCPYLVGNYERVGKELATYVSLGYQTFILDVPEKSEDLIHTRKAFARISEAS